MEDAIIETEKVEKEKENTLPVVSYSKVTSYKDCPRKYKFCYIDKLPRQEKPYTIFGQFCHEILEKFHRFYIDPEDPYKNANMEIPYCDTMKRCFLDAKKKWEPKLTKEQVDEAYQIMLDYLISISGAQDSPNITFVEKKIWMPIDNEFILYGFIDRIQIDSDGILHVVDYKTTKDEKYLKDRTQLLLYAYTEHVNDEKINKFRTSYILLKHKMKPLLAEHSIDELIEAKNKFVEIWQNIKVDKLYRPNPIYYKCNICDYVNQCKEGQSVLFKKKAFGKKAW